MSYDILEQHKKWEASVEAGEEESVSLKLAQDMLVHVRRKLESEAFKEDLKVAEMLCETFVQAKATPEGVRAFEGYREEVGTELRSFEVSYHLIHGQEMGLRTLSGWWVNLEDQLKLYVEDALSRMKEEETNA